MDFRLEPTNNGNSPDKKSDTSRPPAPAGSFSFRQAAPGLALRGGVDRHQRAGQPRVGCGSRSPGKWGGGGGSKGGWKGRDFWFASFCFFFGQDVARERKRELRRLRKLFCKEFLQCSCPASYCLDPNIPLHGYPPDSEKRSLSRAAEPYDGHLGSILQPHFGYLLFRGSWLQ